MTRNSFALFDLDDAVEIIFCVTPAFLDLALNQLVIGCIDVTIERGGDLLDLEGRQKAIVDPFLQGVDVNRFPKIGIGVRVGLALGRRGQAELHGWREILHNAAPIAFIIRSAPVALVDDDEIEEVWRIITKIGRWIAPSIAAAHKSLEDCEEDAAIFRDTALLCDLVRFDPNHCIFGESGKSVVGLIGENVAVSQKQNARPSNRLATSDSIGSEITSMILGTR